MIRHFNRKNLCIKKNEVINYDDNELYKKSLERIYANNVIEKSDKINVCDNCNKFFHTKYALNNHIKMHCKHIDITKFKKPIHIKNTFSGINMRHHVGAIGDTVENSIEDTPIENVVEDTVVDAIEDTPVENVVEDTVVDSIEDAPVGDTVENSIEDTPIENVVEDTVVDAIEDALVGDTVEDSIGDTSIEKINIVDLFSIENIKNDVSIENENISIQINDNIEDIDDKNISIQNHIIDNEVIYIECDNRNNDNNTCMSNIINIKSKSSIKDYFYKTYSYYRYRFYFNCYYYCYSYKYYYEYKNLKKPINQQLTIKDNIHKMIERLHKYIIDYIISDS
jgi:hypothetical protein